MGTFDIVKVGDLVVIDNGDAPSPCSRPLRKHHIVVKFQEVVIGLPMLVEVPQESDRPVHHLLHLQTSPAPPPPTPPCSSLPTQQNCITGTTTTYGIWKTFLLQLV